MLETFKAQLKAKIKTLGVNLSTQRIDAIAARLHAKKPDITEVADHDSLIDDFNDLQPLADIAKQDDRVRTLEAKTKGQPPKEEEQDSPDDDETGKPTGTGKKKATDEPPAWAKSLIDTVNTLKSEKAQTSMQQKVDAMLKDAVPPSFYKGRALPEKDEDLDAFIEAVKTDHTAFKQDLINQGLMTANTPLTGDAGKVSDKAFEASIEAFVADKKGVTTSTK